MSLVFKLKKKRFSMGMNIYNTMHPDMALSSSMELDITIASGVGHSN